MRSEDLRISEWVDKLVRGTLSDAEANAFARVVGRDPKAFEKTKEYLEFEKLMRSFARENPDYGSEHGQRRT